MKRNRDKHDEEDNDHGKWRTVLGSLQVEMSNGGDFQTYLADADGTQDEDGTLIVEVRNVFVKEWIRSRMMGKLRRAVEIVYGNGTKVKLDTPTGPGIEELRGTGLADDHQEWSAADQARHRAKLARQNAMLYPALGNMSLDGFLTSKTNQVAYDACINILDSPGESYNPLFIVAETGLGKTHLCNGLARAMRAKGANVITLTAETFLNEYVDASLDSKIPQLRDRFRDADALVVDGVEKLVGKQSTQTFFLDILDHHIAHGTQVVVSGNSSHPLSQLSPEIISRLSGGLEVRIGQPDTELNSHLIAQYAKQKKVNLLPEAIEYLASRAGADIRGLLGSVARVAAEVTFNPDRGPGPPQVTRAMAAEVAGDRLVAPSPRLATPDDVLRAVSEAFGVSLQALTQRGRGKLHLTTARDAAIFLLREEAGMTSKSIGDLFSGRSHSTILDAQRRYEKRRDAEPPLMQTEAEARRLLGAKRQRG